jgi:hypothetical protein
MRRERQMQVGCGTGERERETAYVSTIAVCSRVDTAIEGRPLFKPFDAAIH